MNSFPAPGLASRSTLAEGRWTGLRIQTDDTMVGLPPLEIPVSGRRIIIQPAILQTAYTVVIGALPPDIAGLYCADPDFRAILWFNAVGQERLIPALPNPPYYRLFGSGIYLTATTPIDYVISFDKLFLQVLVMGALFQHPAIVMNVEQWTKEKGDQS